MDTTTDILYEGTYEKAIALYKLDNGAWTPFEKHVQHDGQQHWLCLHQSDDGSGDIMMDIGIGVGETPLFSHKLSAHMECVVDEDALFIEVHISDDVSYGCYFVEDRLAYAFKSLWDLVTKSLGEKSTDEAGTMDRRISLRLESFKEAEIIAINEKKGITVERQESSCSVSAISDGSLGRKSTYEEDESNGHVKQHSQTNNQSTTPLHEISMKVNNRQSVTPTSPFRNVDRTKDSFGIFKSLGNGFKNFLKFFSGKKATKNEVLSLKEIMAILGGLSGNELFNEYRIFYNSEKCRYEGEIRPQWININNHFSVDYEYLVKTKIPAYDSEIPCILQMLKRLFMEKKGADLEGIFRIAPGREQCDLAMVQIDAGEFEDCEDAHIVANLIKIFFRSLPENVCSEKAIPEKVIYLVADSNIDEAYKMLMDIQNPWKSIILWLLDLMAIVVQNEKVNKMCVKNISVVMAPNLFTPNIENPMAALTKSQKVVEFLQKLLSARLKHYYKLEPDAVKNMMS